MSESIENSRVWKVLLVSILLVSLLLGFIWWLGSVNTSGRDPINDVFMVVGTVASVVGLIFSVWITFLSINSEAALRESLALTRKSTSSQTHLFDHFYEHIGWLEENLHPGKFSNHGLRLHFSISTFAYGIGVLGSELTKDQNGLEKTSAWRFCEFLESWISFLETKTKSSDPPNVHITLWDKEERSRVFDDGTMADEPPPVQIQNARLNVINRYRVIASRLIDLRSANKLNLSIVYSNMSDTRLFLVKDSQSFQGLMVIFTPLSQSSIKHAGWRVCGLSVNDEKGYTQLHQFFSRLALRDHDPSRLPDDLVERSTRKDELIDELIAAATTTTPPTTTPPTTTPPTTTPSTTTPSTTTPSTTTPSTTPRKKRNT
jgi:hypothetical protein